MVLICSQHLLHTRMGERKSGAKDAHYNSYYYMYILRDGTNATNGHSGRLTYEYIIFNHLSQHYSYLPACHSTSKEQCCSIHFMSCMLTWNTQCRQTHMYVTLYTWKESTTCIGGGATSYFTNVCDHKRKDSVYMQISGSTHIRTWSDGYTNPQQCQPLCLSSHCRDTLQAWKQ